MVTLKVMAPRKRLPKNTHKFRSLGYLWLLSDISVILEDIHNIYTLIIDQGFIFHYQTIVSIYPAYLRSYGPWKMITES